MKTRLLTFILTLGFIILTGCNSDDDNNTVTNPLHGLWNLKRVVPQPPPNNVLDDGAITYTFDTDNLILTVENNDESIVLILPSGVYPYTIAEYEGDDYIVMDENGWNVTGNDGNFYGFLITQEGNQLTIDLTKNNGNIGITDMPIWSFER